MIAPLRPLILVIASIWAVAVGIAAAADEPRDISWDDLKAAVKFEDPFEKLTEEQLLDLGIIARVQSLEARDGGSRVSEGMRKEAADSRARLVEQEIDIEGLFAKRKEITELRRKRASATVPELAGVLLSLPGFVLPLEYEGKKVTEFLLVPWVGACIHTPPPPPNQIVHVVAGTPFESKGMFEAVTVTGTMKIGGVSKELFLVDGTADIQMSYSMNPAAVAKYEKE